VKFLKTIGPWIISAALCLVAVEMLGAAMFYRNTRSIVYFNQQKAAAEMTASESTAGPVFKRRLHPYFGYTGPYSIPTYTNNLGFLDPQERQVPFKPEPNDFIVFIFGGSIAARLANNSTHGTSLQQALQRLPQLAGKNIVLYNMAQGPAKQPQQLMELAYLIAVGQHIDLVLNLDGTLEFVSGISNFEFGIDPIFPPIPIMLAIGNEFTPIDDASDDYYELAYGVTHARAESRRYSLLLDHSTSGIAYVKNRFFKAIYDRSLERKLGAYNKTIANATGGQGVRKRLGLDMPIKTSKEKIVEDIFDMWLRCSDVMKVMANSTGAAYLNIVHPNLYYSKKVFTESEKALMNIPELNYVRQSSSAGLALIDSRAEMLKSRGIVSGMGIFDNIPEAIFIDGTGHLDKLGESMLADFVADQVGLRLASPQGK
jgi:hypothetical protein